MAHTCPECYQLCHCLGDIDDIDFGENNSCICCLPVEIKCAKCGDKFTVPLHKKDFEGLAWCDLCVELKEEQD